MSLLAYWLSQAVAEQVWTCRARMSDLFWGQKENTKAFVEHAHQRERSKPFMFDRILTRKRKFYRCMIPMLSEPVAIEPNNWAVESLKQNVCLTFALSGDWGVRNTEYVAHFGALGPEASVKKQANCTQTETCVFPSKEQCSFLSRMAHSNMLILFCADKYPISENEVNSAQTEPCVLPIPKEQDGSWHYSKDMLILKGAQSGFVHYCVQGCKGTSFHERISCRFSNFWELELN